MRTLKLLALAPFALAVACGGGGGDQTPPATPSTPDMSEAGAAAPADTSATPPPADTAATPPPADTAAAAPPADTTPDAGAPAKKKKGGKKKGK
ncbi:MAG TPA: hypothetical protein VGI39_46215 [Polyangiaceae bacterium]